MFSCAATLAVLSERLEAEVANGRYPDPLAYVRLSGALSRALARLGLVPDADDDEAAAKGGPVPDLNDYLRGAAA